MAAMKSMDDVGTRLEHLAEVYELWQTGISILDTYEKTSPHYMLRHAELEAACKLLYFYMTQDYKEERAYRGDDPRPFEK
jgi:hypothetical protein